MAQTDIELVYLAKAGNDDRAFAELVRRHQGRLRAFLLRLTGDASIVDDIAQLSLMKAHSALASFRGGGSFRAWLYAIAYREFLQEKRRVGAVARIEETARNEIVAEDGVVTLASDISMDLKDALLKVPESERACLLLCDAAGFTHAEAAATLGAPLGSVKSWVARGREKMRALLTPTPEIACDEKGRRHAG